jgi:hypothetical protein
MQLEGSLLRLQKPATCPNPQPEWSSPCPLPPPSYLSKIHFNIILPPMPRSSKWSPSLWFAHQNPTCTSHLPHTCYMPCPSQSLFDQLNDIWWKVESIKLLVTQSSPLPSYLTLLKAHISSAAPYSQKPSWPSAWPVKFQVCAAAGAQQYSPVQTKRLYI